MHVYVRQLPLWIEPVRAFEHIPGARKFLLDSSLAIAELGRWSFLGADPFLFFTSDENRMWVDCGGSVTESAGDPFRQLSGILTRYEAAPRDFPPFACGAVGCFSYDLGRMIEHIPATALRDVLTPDIQLGLYDCTLSFDHADKRVFICYVDSGREKAEDWISRLEHSLPIIADDDEYTRFSGYKETAVRIGREALTGCHSPITSNFSRDDYLEAIRRVQDYIAAGDVYQVNLAQRFSGEYGGDSWRLYRILREINPSPFGCFFGFDDLTLVSVSPERLLRLDSKSRLVETRPIKGTRPRGTDKIDDERLRNQLAASEKDRAENVMIVDMERNDLGRVCEYGSVHVPELWAIEAHPNVFQMVSTVRGTLPPGKSPVDLLKASFPGGSITGAPKVRAMEIIEEIEPVRRGIYTGSVGYIDFCGNMDLNIVIRSIVRSGERAYFHGGGGILAYSEPEAEYEETLQKVSGLAAALKIAGEVGNDI